MHLKLLAFIAALALAAAIAVFAPGPAVATEPEKATPPPTTRPPTLRPIGKNLDDLRDRRGGPSTDDPATDTGDDDDEPLGADDDDDGGKKEDEKKDAKDEDDETDSAGGEEEEEDEPIVPGEDDDDDGEWDKEDPKRILLNKKLVELETKKKDIEKKIDGLSKDFRDSEEGNDADKKIDKLDADKKSALKKIDDTVKEMRAEAEAEYRKEFPGAPVACCVDSKLYDESRNYETKETNDVLDAHDKAVDEVLRSELEKNAPGTLKEYQGLKGDLKQVKTEKSAVNKALTVDPNVENAPKVQP